MSFDALVGNRALVARLSRMARSEKVPPSLLFTGPPGVGKLSAAKAIAQALNCPVARGEGCGSCPSCARIERDEHADVRILKPEGAGRQLKVEGVRQVVLETPFRPFEGRRRVAIFVDAERMNPTSANTLLKTLEEPPPWALLILITGNASALLPTILSRCQIYRFAPLPIEDLTEILVNEHEMTRTQATLLASLSGGSLTRALAYQDEPLTDLRAEAVRVARVAAEGGSERELVPLADQLSKNKKLIVVLQLLVGIARDVAANRAGGVLVHRDLEADLEALSTRASLPTWLEAYRLAEEALDDIEKRYLNKRITLARLLTSYSKLVA